MSNSNDIPSKQPWKPFQEIVDGVNKVLKKANWTWCRNQRCKYITIKIDTRDRNAILCDRYGNLMELKDFERQYKGESND